MKRNILFIVYLLLATTGAQAQNTLNVYQKDGSLLCFSFADKPITLFDGDDVVVKTNKQNICFPFSSIDKYTFEDGLVPTGIMSIQTLDSSSESISIYAMDGKLLNTGTCKNGNFTEIQIGDLPSGTYIIKNKNVTYKFKKQ